MKKQGNTDETFAQVVQRIAQKQDFLRFDRFVIAQMTGKLDRREPKEDTRREAYHIFRDRTGKYDFASLPTMKRWFGINGYAVPHREQIFAVSFFLHLSEEELYEWLTIGLGEPGVQFNDYHEVIWLYALLKQKNWKEAEKLVHSYENTLESETVFVRTHTTNQLMEQFGVHKNASEEEFMQWMYSNASSFKGYSQTTLDYLNIYKRIITQYICQDAGKQLKNLLAETDFSVWLRSRTQKDVWSQEEAVSKYIYYLGRKKDRSISEDLFYNIRELNRIANAEENSKQNLLSELFMVSVQDTSLGNLTPKHLSDLLNLPLQVERSMRADIALKELHEMSEAEECPEWIQNFMQSCTKRQLAVSKVSEAVKWLERFKAEHHRRCHMVQRKDILPMILFVAQRRYQEQEEMSEYQYEPAKENFVELANATLSACGMTALNTAFKLDALLLAAYQKDEMYSYTEIMEILSGM